MYLHRLWCSGFSRSAAGSAAGGITSRLADVQVCVRERERERERRERERGERECVYRYICMYIQIYIHVCGIYN